MIIDRRWKPEHADHFDVVDAETGEVVTDWVYADDRRGCLVVEVRDDEGKTVMRTNHRGVSKPHLVEVRHPIQIIPKGYTQTP